MDSSHVRNYIAKVRYVAPQSAFQSAIRRCHELQSSTTKEPPCRAALPVGPTSSPAFGKQGTDLPFYKNVALVIPVVVSSLVLVMVIFIVGVCLRKHSQDRRGTYFLL
ncbi:uncharacterized protein TNCV_3261371 [Trichonephila clavipes]|nr:uncharacterized protein TNCV_3261371 [Trichonephila clavipes]